MLRPTWLNELEAVDGLSLTVSVSAEICGPDP
jgi:hypothetical protein